VPISRQHIAVVAFEFHEGGHGWLSELHVVPRRLADTVEKDAQKHLGPGRQREKISTTLLRRVKLGRIQRRVRKAALESLRKKVPKSAQGIYAPRHFRRGRPRKRRDQDLAKVVHFYEIGTGRRMSPLYPWIAREMKIEPSTVPDLIRAARQRGLMTKARKHMDGGLTARGRRLLERNA
jgi:hypothetical protein